MSCPEAYFSSPSRVPSTDRQLSNVVLEPSPLRVYRNWSGRGGGPSGTLSAAAAAFVNTWAAAPSTSSGGGGASRGATSMVATAAAATAPPIQPAHFSGR